MHPIQLKAARAMLNWSQAQMAEKLGISRVTLLNMEASNQPFPLETSIKIKTELYKCGIHLQGENGVSLGKPPAGVKFFTGSTMMQEFYAELKETIKLHNPIIRITGVNETRFRQEFGNTETDNYVDFAEHIPNLDVRVITCKAHDSMRLSYVKYKLIDSEYFSPYPIYIFHNKVAFFMWDTRTILQVEDDNTSKTQCLSFDFAWDKLQ